MRFVFALFREHGDVASTRVILDRETGRSRGFGFVIMNDDAETDRTTIGLAEPDGPATLETDAAARVLLLWGRRPADPSRICSRVGPEALGRVRRLLSGY